MLSPETVFTKEGAEEFKVKLWLVSDGLFHITNNEDDLEIDGNDLDILHKAKEVVDRMREHGR